MLFLYKNLIIGGVMFIFFEENISLECIERNIKFVSKFNYINFDFGKEKRGITYYKMFQKKLLKRKFLEYRK